MRKETVPDVNDRLLVPRSIVSPKNPNARASTNISITCWDAGRNGNRYETSTNARSGISSGFVLSASLVFPSRQLKR
jgi:hypothetical protein